MPRAAQRIEDFGEVLRFQVDEIEDALGRVRRPVSGDHPRLAETLHRVTLGVPLALRGLLDLHEDGVDVFADLKAPEGHESLDQSEAVRQVITDLTDRWLLNLEGHPERSDDLRDITTLALLPAADPGVLNACWQPVEPHERLRKLSQRYSLLSDGDLHPTVRACLRRCWRDKTKRHEHFTEVLTELDCHIHAIHGSPDPADRQQRMPSLFAQLNLRSWREGPDVIPDLARALCLARAFEMDSQPLETLLTELSPGPVGNDPPGAFWHRHDGRRPEDKDILTWLRAQRQTAKEWTQEEEAALALLEGLQFVNNQAPAQEACAAFASLEQAVDYFGLETLPRSETVGQAYFCIGCALDPYRAHRPSKEHLSVAAASYRKATELRASKAVVYNNLANFYGDDLGSPELGKQYYLKAIELDPKLAGPHNGLGVLYRGHLNQPEKAKACYLKAIELDPKLASPHNGLGVLYQEQFKQPEKAEACYLKAIELDPKFAIPHNSLGSLYRGHLKQPEKAEACYLKAIELDPKLASPHNGLGVLYQDQFKQPEKAEARYLQAIELDPKNAIFHNNLASLYQHHLKQPQKAEVHYRKAGELDPKFKKT